MTVTGENHKADNHHDHGNQDTNNDAPSRRKKSSPHNQYGQEAGRQGSPQRSLLHGEGNQHMQRHLVDRPDIQVMSSNHGNNDRHTYENVQDIRGRPDLPPAGHRQRNKNKHDKKAQKKPCSPTAIPMTPLHPQSISPEESPHLRRHRSPSTDPSIMLESTGTLNSCGSSNTYTMTGTLKRSKKREQAEPVEVELQLTQAELDRLNRSTELEDVDKGRGRCGAGSGPHVVLLSLLYMPLAFLSSLCMCFYVGTMCWYNIYLCLSEEKTVWHKVFLCPLLIIFYPVLILSVSLGLAVFAAVKQLSWHISSWLREIKDFEKGFFGWLCNKLGVAECSPYEVIILNESGVESPTGGSTAV